MRRDVINVQLGAGVDTKTDPKAVDLGELLSSQNLSFITLRSLQKRNGNLILPGAGNAWDGLGVFNASLVAQTTTGILYAVSIDAGGSLLNLGTMQPMAITSQTVQSSGSANLTLSSTASATVAAPNPALPTPQGIQVTAWEASTGGLYWQIADLYSGALIQVPTLLSATGISPRCIAANNQVFIFWIDTSGGGVLRASQFLASNPTIPPSTAALSATAPDTANPAYDVIYAADTNRFWICFKANGHAIPYVCSNSGTNLSVVTAAIQTPGIADNLLTPGTIALQYIANVLYAFTVGSNLANTARVNFSVLSNTPASLANGTSGNISTSGAGTGPMALAYGAAAGSTQWNILLQSPQPATATAALVIFTYGFTASGGTSAFTNGGAFIAQAPGLHLVSGFVKLAATQSYGVVCWQSPQQATYFVVDQALRIHGKFLAQTAGAAPDSIRNRLTDLSPAAVGAGVYNVAVAVQANVTAVNGAIVTHNGVQLVTIDFTPAPAMLGAQLGQNLHLTGGQLWNFDGVSLTEHGFHVYPEWIASAGSQFDAPTFGLIMNQPAINVAGQVTWQIQCPPASLIKNGAYIQLGSAYPGLKPIFIILGIGSVPATPAWITGGEIFNVALSATDSAATVAQKIFQVLGPTPVGIAGLFTPGFLSATLLGGQNAIQLTATMPANFGSLFGPIKNNQELGISQVQPGAGAAKQEVALFCPAAKYLATGQYFMLQGNTAIAGQPSTMPVWFKIAGVGTAPTVGGANVAPLQITLAGTETETQVAAAINAAINAAVGAQAIFTSAVSATFTNSLILTDAINGTGALGGWNVTASGNLARTQGTTTSGVYGYAFTYRWVDDAGQTHQSAPSPIVSVPIGPGLQEIGGIPIGNNVSCGSALIQIPTLRASNKTGVTIDVWRTIANGSILERVTTTANGLANNPGVDFITYQDTLSDDLLAGDDLLYTAGELANVGPTGSCQAITKFQNRLVLSGLEDGRLVQFSQAFVPGSGIMFNGGLAFRMDQFSGVVTTSAVLDSNLIVFSESQLAYINGSGPDPLGNGAFSVPALIEGQVGCLGANLVAKCQLGLVFVSEKGIYLLDRSLTVNYIGAPAEALINGPSGSPGATVTAVLAVEDANEVRFYTSSGFTVVWDYFIDPEDPSSWVGKWTSHTTQNGVAAVNWQGSAVFADSVLQSLFMENPGSYEDGATPFTYQFELGWVDETAKRQGFTRVFQALLQGIFQVGQALTIDFQYDNDTSYTDTITWTPAIDGDGNSYGGSVYGANTYGGQTTTPQPITSGRLNPPRHRCSQIKVRLTEATPSNQPLSCTAITFEIATGEGTWRKGTNLAG